MSAFLDEQREVFNKERNQMLTILLFFDVSCFFRAVFDKTIAYEL